MVSERVRRVPDALGAPLDGQLLLLNTEVGSYHSLNPVASRIWELIAEPTDREEIVARLLTEFAVTPERCRHEVDMFLQQLRTRGFLMTV